MFPVFRLKKGSSSFGGGAVLRDGRARLEDVYGFWGGAVNEQIERFMAAWPPELDWDPDMFWVAKPGYGWVPGGFVWKLEAGRWKMVVVSVRRSAGVRKGEIGV